MTNTIFCRFKLNVALLCFTFFTISSHAQFTASNCEGIAPTFPGGEDGQITFMVTDANCPSFACNAQIDILGAATLINEDGISGFSNVPAGTYEVVFNHNGQEISSCQVVVEEGVIDPCEDPLGLAGEDKTICLGETTTIGCV